MFGGTLRAGVAALFAGVTTSGPASRAVFNVVQPDGLLPMWLAELHDALHTHSVVLRARGRSSSSSRNTGVDAVLALRGMLEHLVLGWAVQLETYLREAAGRLHAITEGLDVPQSDTRARGLREAMLELDGHEQQQEASARMETQPQTMLRTITVSVEESVGAAGSGYEALHDDGDRDGDGARGWCCCWLNGSPSELGSPASDASACPCGI